MVLASLLENFNQRLVVFKIPPVHNIKTLEHHIVFGNENGRDFRIWKFWVYWETF
jgi:hypothetical protein